MGSVQRVSFWMGREVQLDLFATGFNKMNAKNITPSDQKKISNDLV
jgi:hypothetical protein